jgi:uncharacterized protein (UPF0332 family)
MAFAEDLLEQAEHLARREPNRPKQASLRRAVSTAYYALFHLLISETIRNWRRPSERNTLARMFDHGVMSKACDKKYRELEDYFKTHPQADPRLPAARHLHLIAETFTIMQQRRHEADYDGSVKWTRIEAIARVKSVEKAFQSWSAIRNEPAAQDFLVTLLLKKR